ncbi:MAG TPA: C69 family dipeptidase [Candidatus Krumholzibacteriaceae bacterium]|nr:C69 family dipeptidase [Candidatus Krumholzibacteriaceae bacterium]
MRRIFCSVSVVSLAIIIFSAPAPACTNMIVTSSASEDGSVMITYTCDGEFLPHLRHIPAADHKKDEYIEIKDWHGNIEGRIKQVPHTFAVTNLINERQVVIGETTFTGRKELRNEDALLHYWQLMRLALQRAATAREAVEVIADLVSEYGYSSTGESFSIGDKNEAWLMEIIGTGPGGEGAVWVARRVPEGYICAHANKARIGEFPLDDPRNCLYSDNVIDFAVKKGYYNPESGKPFNFSKAYCPATPQKLRYTATRVWSIFRRCAPSKKWPVDYHRGERGAKPYPLWIKPDKKLSLEDVIDIMRDHYEGTEYDMTEGVDAGPFGTPNRWRPITWKIDGTDYTWERPVSTQQTGFSFVSQSRSHLPDPIGGLLWYGVDDTYFTCYIPLYCGISDVPESYSRGRISEFSGDSAWWVFNFVANFSNLRYSQMRNDIQAVQEELEGKLISLQPAVEMTAERILEEDEELLTAYLTDYSNTHAEMVVERFRELGKQLIRKYNDGYTQTRKGRPEETGYPESWLRDVLKQRPDQFKLKSRGGDSLETQMPY